MTPAINLAKKLKLTYKIYEYTHDASASSYGLEAAEKLGVTAERVFKTLVVKADNGQLAVAILPVENTLNFKKMAKALCINKTLSCKKVQMAEPQEVQRSSGYVLGGVSPLGQKKRLATVIDSSAQQHSTIYVSAGRRGLEIELPASELAATLKAQFADIIDE
ncbi:Cys-tRNA(Pro) deacylase [Psychrobacter sp. 1Y11]|uniref:Cys-tRNA(Pro) deacylase n=1 Tax=Psychrobacter sp. 1Y11 TaxID=3457446 RepID=UPI003FD22585